MKCFRIARLIKLCHCADQRREVECNWRKVKLAGNLGFSKICRFLPLFNMRARKSQDCVSRTLSVSQVFEYKTSENCAVYVWLMHLDSLRRIIFFIPDIRKGSCANKAGTGCNGSSKLFAVDYVSGYINFSNQLHINVKYNWWTIGKIDWKRRANWVKSIS